MSEFIDPIVRKTAIVRNARMNRWIPRVGEQITIKGEYLGDGLERKTVTGIVERTSKTKCGPGMIEIWLRGIGYCGACEDGWIIITR
ncbi:MAG: hypothetical protein ABSG56_10720 [Bryobacteraceae bacterium]|jgi:hypothetical protein